MGKPCATNFTSDVKCGSCGSASPKVVVQPSHVALIHEKHHNIEEKKKQQKRTTTLRTTLQGTNISPKNGILNFEDDFPFPKVGYVNSLEGNPSFSLNQQG